MGRRPIAWLCGALALGLATACPGEDDPGPPREPIAAPEATLELQVQAQREALQRLVPKVAALGALEDPLTASVRDGTPPRMPPLTAGDRNTLREALEAARRESEGLTPRRLEPTDRVVAIAALFAINRARDLYVEHAPWADDPTWVTREAGLVVEQLELSSRREGTCIHCASALPHLAAAIEAVTPNVRSSSEPRSTAAAADARSLAARVRALPGLLDAPETGTAATALEAFAAAIEALAGSPARWEAKALQRHLEVEENLSDPPVELFKSLGSGVATLAAMSRRHPSPPQGPPSPVTAQRCADAWAVLERVAQAQEALDAGAFDCARFVAGLGAVPLDDVELRLALVDTALIVPSREAAIRSLPPTLGFIGGRITRGSQRHTLRTAILLAAPELAPTAARSLQAELDAACLTAAALWIHGGLGDDAALGERLSPHCPRETSVYIADAEARPRQALEGLALARIPQGPAGVVPLDKLWWLPLGLVEDVALPPDDHASGPSPVRAVIEPLDDPRQEPAP